MRELINKMDKAEARIEELKKELSEAIRDRQMIITEIIKISEKELSGEYVF